MITAAQILDSFDKPTGKVSVTLWVRDSQEDFPQTVELDIEYRGIVTRSGFELIPEIKTKELDLNGQKIDLTRAVTTLDYGERSNRAALSISPEELQVWLDGSHAPSLQFTVV